MAERSLAPTLKRAPVVTIALIVIIATLGYLLFRWMKPVTTEEAVELFHTRNDRVTSGSYEVDPPDASDAPVNVKRSQRAEHKAAKPATASRGTSRPRPASHRTAADRTNAVVAATRPESSFDVMPAEGVYRYEGSGEETVNGVKRDFPAESHRIITHEDRDTWQEHHVFGEDRESWTRITTGSTGRLVHSQRNLIGIAGHTVRDTDVPFRPPLSAVRFPHRVGETWIGRFEGTSHPDNDDYTGIYSVRTIGDEKWDVGGNRVRVLGYQMDLEFEGELEASATVKYWFAPLHGVTVHEYYSIDAVVEGLDYHAEWDVRLVSLTART